MPAEAHSKGPRIAGVYADLLWLLRNRAPAATRSSKPLSRAANRCKLSIFETMLVDSEESQATVSKRTLAMKKHLLCKIAIVVAAMAIGGAGMASDALARGGGGGGGGAFAGAHFGGVGGRQFSGAGRARPFAGRAVHRRFGRVWAAPYGYYDDSGYYDPAAGGPNEQPSYTTGPSPNMPPPRHSGCTTQTYKVPSEAGGQASVDVVHC